MRDPTSPNFTIWLHVYGQRAFQTIPGQVFLSHIDSGRTIDGSVKLDYMEHLPNYLGSFIIAPLSNGEYQIEFPDRSGPPVRITLAGLASELIREPGWWSRIERERWRTNLLDVFGGVRPQEMDFQTFKLRSCDAPLGNGDSVTPRVDITEQNYLGSFNIDRLPAGLYCIDFAPRGAPRRNDTRVQFHISGPMQ